MIIKYDTGKRTYVSKEERENNVNLISIMLTFKHNYKKEGYCKTNISGFAVAHIFVKIKNTNSEEPILNI